MDNNIKILAPNIHKFTSVGFGRITFEGGIPYIVKIELKDTIESQKKLRYGT